MKKILITICCTLIFFCSCEIAEVSTKIACKSGVITADQAKSLTRSVKAVDKAQQKLTDKQEYYVGRAVIANILQNYKPLDNDKANQYLNILGQSLAIFSDLPETFGGYHFLLLDSDEVNAFAAPGGLILITRAMVQCCSSEDELAAVLAHEICHVAFKHGVRAIKQGRLTEALTVLAAESAKQMGNAKLAELTGQFEASVGDVVKTLTARGYSRELEYDADAGAVKLLQSAGYEQTAIIAMLENMDKRLAKSHGLGFAKTHPSPAKRIESLRSIGLQGEPAVNAQRTRRFYNAMSQIIKAK